MKKIILVLFAFVSVVSADKCDDYLRDAQKNLDHAKVHRDMWESEKKYLIAAADSFVEAKYACDKSMGEKIQKKIDYLTGLIALN